MRKRKDKKDPGRGSADVPKNSNIFSILAFQIKLKLTDEQILIDMMICIK